MGAILDRELKAYYGSPLGYLFTGVVFLFTGFFFFAYNLYGNTSDLRSVFSMLFTVILFLIPILTMRLLSEDKKLKTDQLLLTAPVSRTGIVLGKYCSALCVYLLSLMGTMVCAAVLSRLGEPEWPVIFGHFLGLFLFGSALIAICLFLSSLTESQVLAAVGGFAVSFLLILIDVIAPVAGNETLAAALRMLSFKNRYAAFTFGTLHLPDMLFFMSVSFLFLCLTVLTFERRKGAGKGVFWGLIAALLAAVLLLNVAVGLLGQRVNLTADLTTNQIFALEDETKAFAAEIAKPVEIFVLTKESDFVGSSTYMAQANETLKQFEKASEQITLRYVNFVADPTFAAGYPDLALVHGDLLFSSEGNHKVLKTSDLFNYVPNNYNQPVIASSKSEQAIASAILSVTNSEKVKVSILEGHGEFAMPAFTKLLENNNFEMVFENPATADISEDADIAALIAPHTDLSPDVVKKLDQFLYNRGNYGKTLLYTADAEQKALPNLEAFLKEWGVSVGDGSVFETSSKRVYNYHPFYAVADYAEESFSGALRDLNAPMLMSLAKPLTRSYETRNNNSTLLLLQFGESAAVRPSDASPSFSQGDAAWRGPIDAMVLASYTAKDKRSNILVSGSTGMLDGYAIENSSLANSDYLTGLLSKLAGRQESITIKAKTLTGKELNITTATANALGIVLTLVLPLLIIGTGIIIWLRRRHQ